MKALSVTKDKIVLELSINSLYSMYNALTVVRVEYDQLDKDIIDQSVEQVDAVLAELNEVYTSITDADGNIKVA